MSVSSHIAELEKRHQVLSQKIEEELKHPGADDLHLTELKREKLRLKDEIHRQTKH